MDHEQIIMIKQRKSSVGMLQLGRCTYSIVPTLLDNLMGTTSGCELASVLDTLKHIFKNVFIFISDRRY